MSKGPQRKVFIFNEGFERFEPYLSGEQDCSDLGNQENPFYEPSNGEDIAFPRSSQDVRSPLEKMTNRMFENVIVAILINNRKVFFQSASFYESSFQNFLSTSISSKDPLFIKFLIDHQDKINPAISAIDPNATMGDFYELKEEEGRKKVVKNTNHRNKSCFQYACEIGNVKAAECLLMHEKFNFDREYPRDFFTKIFGKISEEATLKLLKHFSENGKMQEISACFLNRNPTLAKYMRKTDSVKNPKAFRNSWNIFRKDYDIEVFSQISDEKLFSFFDVVFKYCTKEFIVNYTVQKISDPLVDADRFSKAFSKNKTKPVSLIQEMFARGLFAEVRLILKKVKNLDVSVTQKLLRNHATEREGLVLHDIAATEVTEENKDAFWKVAKVCQDFSQKDESGKTALRVAVENNNINAINFLIKAGAQKNLDLDEKGLLDQASEDTIKAFKSAKEEAKNQRASSFEVKTDQRHQDIQDKPESLTLKDQPHDLNFERFKKVLNETNHNSTSSTSYLNEIRKLFREYSAEQKKDLKLSEQDVEKTYKENLIAAILIQKEILIEATFTSFQSNSRSDQDSHQGFINQLAATALLSGNKKMCDLLSDAITSGLKLDLNQKINSAYTLEGDKNQKTLEIAEFNIDPAKTLFELACETGNFEFVDILLKQSNFDFSKNNINLVFKGAFFEISGESKNKVFKYCAEQDSPDLFKLVCLTCWISRDTGPVEYAFENKFKITSDNQDVLDYFFKDLALVAQPQEGKKILSKELFGILDMIFENYNGNRIADFFVSSKLDHQEYIDAIHQYSKFKSPSVAHEMFSRGLFAEIFNFFIALSKLKSEDREIKDKVISAFFKSKDGEETIFHAIAKTKLETEVSQKAVLEILKHATPQDLSKKDPEGRSPLRLAVESDNFFAVSLLTSKGADIKEEGLVKACTSEAARKTLKGLIEKSNTQDPSQTTQDIEKKPLKAQEKLKQAIDENNAQEIEKILKHHKKFELNQAIFTKSTKEEKLDPNCKTLLDYAIFNKKYTAALALVKSGATFDTDYLNQTSLSQESKSSPKDKELATLAQKQDEFNLKKDNADSLLEKLSEDQQREAKKEREKAKKKAKKERQKARKKEKEEREKVQEQLQTKEENPNKEENPKTKTLQESKEQNPEAENKPKTENPNDQKTAQELREKNRQIQENEELSGKPQEEDTSKTQADLQQRKLEKVRRQQELEKKQKELEEKQKELEERQKELKEREVRIEEEKQKLAAFRNQQKQEDQNPKAPKAKQSQLTDKQIQIEIKKRQQKLEKLQKRREDLKERVINEKKQQQKQEDQNPKAPKAKQSQLTDKQIQIDQIKRDEAFARELQRQLNEEAKEEALLRQKQKKQEKSSDASDNSSQDFPDLKASRASRSKSRHEKTALPNSQDPFRQTKYPKPKGQKPPLTKEQNAKIREENAKLLKKQQEEENLAPKNPKESQENNTKPQENKVNQEGRAQGAKVDLGKTKNEPTEAEKQRLEKLLAAALSQQMAKARAQKQGTENVAQPPITNDNQQNPSQEKIPQAQNSTFNSLINSIKTGNIEQLQEDLEKEKILKEDCNQNLFKIIEAQKFDHLKDSDQETPDQLKEKLRKLLSSALKRKFIESMELPQGQEIFSVEFFHNAGLKLDKVWVNGKGEKYYPLRRAIQLEKIEAVKDLCKFGAKPEQINNDHLSCVGLAIDKKRFDILEVLIENCSDLNHKSKFGYTTLSQLAYYQGGQQDEQVTTCIKKLLAKGVDTFSSDSMSINAAHNLLLQGRKKEVKLVIQAMKKQSISIDVIDQALGLTLLQIAVATSQTDMVQYLFQQGATLTSQSFPEETGKALPEEIATKIQGKEIIDVATNYNNLEMSIALVSNGASENMALPLGNQGVVKDMQTNTNLTRYFLTVKSRAQKNLVSSVDNLIHACVQDDNYIELLVSIETLKELDKEKNTNNLQQRINLKNDQGLTPLDIANEKDNSSKKKTEIIKYLKENGAKTSQELEGEREVSSKKDPSSSTKGLRQKPAMLNEPQQPPYQSLHDSR